MLDANERDSKGNLTSTAIAVDALISNGCDCGEEELGTCLACKCERALNSERSKVEQLRFENKLLRSLMAEAVHDFHAKSVLFSSAFLKASGT